MLEEAQGNALVVEDPPNPLKKGEPEGVENSVSSLINGENDGSPRFPVEDTKYGRVVVASRGRDFTKPVIPLCIKAQSLEDATSVKNPVTSAL